MQGWAQCGYVGPFLPFFSVPLALWVWGHFTGPWTCSGLGEAEGGRRGMSPVSSCPASHSPTVYPAEWSDVGQAPAGLPAALPWCLLWAPGASHPAVAAPLFYLTGVALPSWSAGGA